MKSLAVSSDATRFIALGRGEPPLFTLLLDWAEKLR
jgi:hypothetical protein